MLSNNPGPIDTTTHSDVVLFGVLNDLTARAEMGHQKYGMLLKTHNGRSALLDLYEELLDASMYIKQLLMEADDALSE
jgi:hypothetical protein